MVGISQEIASNGPKMNLALVQSLREVTNEDSDKRIKASIKVLQGVRDDEAKRRALTRLIRGTGATMTNSKIGFFTLLSGFLRECGDSVTCSDIFEVMDNELKITNKAKNRETADAFVGRVLTITAMIRQNMLHTVSTEDLQRCLQVIVETSKLKSYHSKLAYNALIALVQSEISDKQIQVALLPILRKELVLTWSEHTMASLHFVIGLRERFPKVTSDKFWKESFPKNEILHSESFDDVYRIFWQEQNESSIMQPSYEALAKYAAQSPNLAKFVKYLVQRLQASHSRNREVITVKVMTEIVNQLPSLSVVPKILIKDFWAIVFQSAKFVKPTDEILRAVYLEFFEAIFNVLAKADQDLQYLIVRSLLLSPGTLNVDKYPVTNRIVARSINVLHEEVLHRLLELLQNIITEKEAKGGATGSEQQWLYTEKVTALGYMQKVLHNKKVSMEQKTKSIHWLATLGLFEDTEATVNEELSEQIKRLFYKTLESPFVKINEEKKLLVDLLKFIEAKRKAGAVARQPLDKPNGKLWTDVLKEAQKDGASDNLIMFHVLLLHMALQLFNDPELAASAIKELHACMERATTTSLRRKNKRATEEGEPEWTEVMVDLILHLLSQNSVILRNVVKKVFPNICSQLNLSAVHQILSLLDMNEENPLLEQTGGENDEEEEEDDDGDESGDDSNDDKEDEDEDEEDDADPAEEDENDHDASVSDHLRNAISVALMADHKDKDDDQDSIDLDTMTEEEGQRLDEALANAFKLMGSRKGNGKSKTEKMEATALLHFRIRVIDLLIIYLKSGPELVAVAEVLSVLYRMLDQFSEDDAAEQALFKKVQEAIDVAVTSKIPAEVTMSITDIVTYMRTFIAKCANPKGVEERSLALQKIVKFFAQIDNHLPVEKKRKSGECFADVIGEELKLFLTQRAPSMGLNIFQHLLQCNWAGNWQQLTVILTNGLVKENRVFKRVQSLELLHSFMGNVRYLKSADDKAFNEHIKKLHEVLQSYKSLVNGTITPKEFKWYVQLLLDIRLFHNKNPNRQCYLNWSDLESSVRSLRENVECLGVYVQLSKIAGWKITKESRKAAVNGHGDADAGERANGMETEDTAEEKASGRKRKTANGKEKKLKKEKRFKLSSNGLDETIHFTNMS